MVANWTPGPSTEKSLCASTVAFRPGSDVSDSDSAPSAIVSTCDNPIMHLTHLHALTFDVNWMTRSADRPHIVTILYEGIVLPGMSISHLMCFRYAIIHRLKLFATSIRKWTRHLTDFPTSRFQTPNWLEDYLTVLTEIYGHLCISDMAVKTALIDTGPGPFCLQCQAPWGGIA